MMLDTGLQINDTLFFFASVSKEGFTPTLARPIVNHELVVNVQLERTRISLFLLLSR